MEFDKSKIIVDEIAFEGDEQGFHFKCTYLVEPRGQALVEISKNGQLIRRFLFPGYKVWNIAAHARDIVAGLVQNSDSGLYVAGSDGLASNMY